MSDKGLQPQGDLLSLERIALLFDNDGELLIRPDDRGR